MGGQDPCRGRGAMGAMATTLSLCRRFLGHHSMRRRRLLIRSIWAAAAWYWYRADRGSGACLDRCPPLAALVWGPQRVRVGRHEVMASQWRGPPPGALLRQRR